MTTTHNPSTISHQLSGNSPPATRHSPLSVLRLPSSIFLFASFALLWLSLIHQLSLQWSTFDQYTYCWAVPFLCLYLAWKRRASAPSSLLRLPRSADLQSAVSQDCILQAPEATGDRRQETGGRHQESGDKPHEKEDSRQEPGVTSQASGDRSQVSRVTRYSPPATSAQPSTAPPPSHLPTFSLLHPSPATSALPSTISHQLPAAPPPTSDLRLPTSGFQLFSFLFLLLLLFPVRLLHEANPVWRLTTWAWATIVVGLTLAILYRYAGPARARHFAFPILFFLVAVPWPSPLEGPLIQGLTRANAALTVEALSLAGVPALQHGNVIEVGTGAVGIDDACSGIRSFQATLMLALFFGELYRLSALRRSVLCLASFALSFLFNLVRTTLLSAVAAHKGVDAIATWHDPAGVIILLACFTSLWLLARRSGDRRQASGDRSQASGASHVTRYSPPATSALPSTINPQPSTSSPPATRHPLPATGGEPSTAPSPSHLRTFPLSHPSPATSAPPSTLNPQPSTASPLTTRHSTPATRHSLLPSLLFSYLLLCEIGVRAWYHYVETRLPILPAWTVQLPSDAPGFQQLQLPSQTRRTLAYDQGLHVAWEQDPALSWQMVYLRWDPGRPAAQFAWLHSPTACLPAVGMNVTPLPGLRSLPVAGVTLPFQVYRVETAGRTGFVFFCRWGARGDNTLLDDGGHFTRWHRLRSVFEGRGMHGLQVLEVALWGLSDPDHALAAFQFQLPHLLKPLPSAP